MHTATNFRVRERPGPFSEWYTSLPIDGNALAGSIPTEIGQCSQLNNLDLVNNNKLAGSGDFVIIIVLIDGKRLKHFSNMTSLFCLGKADFKQMMKAKVPNCNVFL